jgi:hypothetical protein
MPVFVLTHHERDPLTVSDTTFAFVTVGIESALDQARAAAGGKDVTSGAGARLFAGAGPTWRWSRCGRSSARSVQIGWRAPSCFVEAAYRAANTS